MNKNFEKVRRIIIDHHENLHMPEWQGRNEFVPDIPEFNLCGTVLCIAGFAARMAMNNGDIRYSPDIRVGITSRDGSPLDVNEWAAEYLGLDEEAFYQFSVGDTKEEVAQFLDQTWEDYGLQIRDGAER